MVPIAKPTAVQFPTTLFVPATSLVLIFSVKDLSFGNAVQGRADTVVCR